MNNKIIKTALLLLISAAITSCADNDIVPFSVSKPESIARWEYLDSYGPLKGYVDRSANPGFKLGLALEANDFNSYGVPYRIACSNFDEVTAGNAMKYASCVADDGTMDFSTVKSFVENARLAGITIYGHTLAWHSQQNNKYLNSLIADRELEVDPDAKVEKEDAYTDFSNATSFDMWGSEQAKERMSFENEALKIHNQQAMNYWELQYFGADNIPTTVGGTHKVTMMIKGSGEGVMHLALGSWSSSVNATLGFTDQWKEVSVEISNVPADNSHLILQHGDFVGDVWIKWIKISHTEKPSVTVQTPLVTNGNAEGDDQSCFFSTEKGVGPSVCKIGTAGTGSDGKGKAFVVRSGDNPENSYDTQFFIRSNRTLKAGDKVRLSMKYRADKAAGSESQSHGEPGSYIYWSMGVNLDFTTSWQTYEKDITISSDQAGSSGMKSIALNLSVLKEANTYYFDDISFTIEENSNTVPLTPEEKKDTLIWAMENWIKGMMQATGGYVTTWDLVNEALSGTDKDGDGYYDLQSATRGTVSETDATANFYWQDYLGDLDYVRIASAKAREYYVENGGNASEMKLFINDYNLESDWDNNKKLKSLIHWIDLWEADGTTKIDGIGTQMHVSCYANEVTQQSKKDHIVKMLELLAASGKLIKISELDMGYVDEAGNVVKTEDMTFEQHAAMGELYEFIVSKYFEIIPQAQRYGITQWCATDSLAGSGWRATQPVGLWDINYNRKPAYGGFADGLSGK